MNKFAAEQNAIVEAMSKIASASGLPLTYPVAQRIASIHQYSPVLIMKTAFDITELATNPAVHSVAGGLLGGGLGALMAPKGYGLAGFGLGAGLGAGAGYLGSPYINQMIGPYLPRQINLYEGGTLGSGPFHGGEVRVPGMLDLPLSTLTQQ